MATGTSGTERTIGQLVADATHDLEGIVRGEIALAKAEGTSRQEVIRPAVLDRYGQWVHTERVPGPHRGSPGAGRKCSIALASRFSTSTATTLGSMMTAHSPGDAGR